MPAFEITLPDGRSVDVDAPDAETAAKGAVQWSKANQPSGRALALQDARRAVSRTNSQVRALNRGTTGIGIADEMTAGAGALAVGAKNLLRSFQGKPGVGYGMKDAYDAGMQAQDEADREFGRKHPVQNVGLQIAGGVMSPLSKLGAGYLGRSTSLGSAVARGGVVGTALGAGAGAGNASGGLKARGRGAVQGAVVGGALGAAAPVVVRGAQTVGRAANAVIGQPFGGAQRGAAARLAEALQQDGLDEQQIAQAVQQWRQSGVTPEFLNVAGENTRALIRAAGSQGGPARNAAQGYRDTTVASIPNRAMERANALTPGETRTPAQFGEAMDTARETAAKTDYKPVYAQLVDVTDEIRSALADEAGRSAIMRARRAAVARRNYDQIAEIDDLLAGKDMPSVSAGTLDRIKIAMGQKADSLARNSANDIASGFRGRAADVDASLNTVPGMDAARANFRGYSQGIEAAEDGVNVLGPRSEFAPEIDALGPQGRQGAQIRERQALHDNFSTRDQVRGRLADIAHAPDARPNLLQLYGERGGQFADASENLLRKQDHANYIAPNTGSQTQSRQQDARGFFGVVSNAMEVLGGSFRPIMERLARGLTMTERERDILVQIGIGTPEDAMRALNAAPQISSAGTNVLRRTSPAISSTAAAETQRSGTYGN